VQRSRPPDVVARILAERLRGCAPSDGLRAMVGSQGFDWERVIGHASDQFVLPALAASLEDLGLLESLDEDLGAFLAAVHAANEERNRELSDELMAAVAVLNQADIEPVVLKGAIRLIDGLYPDRGWRMMRDLDLLVPKTRWTDAIGLFQRAGYAPRGEINKEVPLRRPGAVVDIDLHRELFSTARRERLLHADEVLDASCRAAFQDAVVRLPSVAHQIVHLIGHRQLQDHNHAYGRIALRDWFEAAALERWAQEEIDWQAVLERFVAAGYRNPLVTFLLSLEDNDLCALPVPSRIGPLKSLQQQRLRLQGQSTRLGYISSWAVWCVCELRRQVEEHDDAGRLRIIKNARRLIFERGAANRMVRGLVGRAPRRE
jgi:hypothetical protein